MSTTDRELLNWAQKDQRPGVTLGQLVTLLELSEKESVAAMASGSESDAVNYRQKLDRLEKALRIGRLTKRVGKVTLVSELGRRVAGEVRLMLLEFAKGSGRGEKADIWIFGAGDTWLQSVVIPTLARWPKVKDAARWQVANLRNHSICEALIEGRIHFGLLRTADMPTGHALHVLKTYPGAGYTLVISGAGKMLENPAKALEWITEKNHPLIQQGTTWHVISTALSEVGLSESLKSKEPDVICETHPQAVNSVVNGRGWAVVPTVVARHATGIDVQSIEVSRSKPTDEISFVTNLRVLEKLNGATSAADALKHELGLTISGAKK